jgi:hypothetical protein
MRTAPMSRKTMCLLRHGMDWNILDTRAIGETYPQNRRTIFRRKCQDLRVSIRACTYLDCSFLDRRGFGPSHPTHFRAAIHQATVEIITLQQAGKDLNLSTLATSWHPEIQELIAQTKVEIPLGKDRPKLTYPTEKTKGIIIGWFLKAHREKLRKEAESIGTGAEAINVTSKIPEADAEEVDEALDTWDENETMSTTAAIADDIYDTAEVEQSIFAEDEKLAERQRREFEVQHGRDQKSGRTVTPVFFYEAVEDPALGAGQPYLDVKLNFKDELTYFVRIPAFAAFCMLTLDLAISPYHTVDGTSHSGSRFGEGEDAAINPHLSIAASSAAQAQESSGDAGYETGAGFPAQRQDHGTSGNTCRQGEGCRQMESHRSGAQEQGSTCTWKSGGMRFCSAGEELTLLETALDEEVELYNVVFAEYLSSY